MNTLARTLATGAGLAALFGTWAAHAQSSPVTESSLDETLYHTVCERVQAPLVFSTRDTLFALSLPDDEPAEIYLQLTVGKNGKVKDKLTKVHANHIANHVATAFAAATEELRIDRELLAEMQGKDTSLILTFQMQYQCVLDTINKAQPEDDFPIVSFHSLTNSDRILTLRTPEERNRDQEIWVADYPGMMKEKYRRMPLSRVWYYLAFIHEPE